jgi:23S rRNA (pseudouridine1915-N3)-methyltransferase
VRLLVVAVGRVRGSLESAVAEYEERARRYWKLEVVEVEAGTSGKNPAPERVKEAEAERILGRIQEGLAVVALTRGGRGMGSRDLAQELERYAVQSQPGVAFVLGGAFGLGDTVLARARRQLSLSRMTLPHEMARLVLAEQLYRAGTILRGEPYHKGT